MSRIEDVKVWVGAVSRNVLCVAECCAMEDLPVGIIATPNEVSHDGGYLGLGLGGIDGWLEEAVDEYHAVGFVGRDHGNHLPSLVREADGYDITHVDDMGSVVDYVEVLCARSDHMRFEVGQEERKYRYDCPELFWLLSDLRDRLGDDYVRVVYAVVQSGLSLGADECVGEFDGERLYEMCKGCHAHGVKAKMHNSDFLTDEMLRKHVDCNVDSFNIGPELAAIEAKFYRLGSNSKDRYEWETMGVRESFEEEYGEEIRAAIRARIVEFLGVVS